MCQSALRHPVPCIYAAKLSTTMIMSRVLKVLMKSMGRTVMPQKQIGFVLYHITKFMHLYEK